MTFLFWTLIFIVFYAYLGYGIILYLMVKVKRLFFKTKVNGFDEAKAPTVTLLIAAYNEVDYMDEKVANCLALDYPEDKLNIMFVTDGSDDGTPKKLQEYQEFGIQVLHHPQRAGKIMAMNRGMGFVDSDIVVFTDANTDLNREAIKELVKHFQNDGVGCVAGEKHIRQKSSETASGAGEGLYWKYESALKRLDSELYCAMGAAGELFAIRTDLFEHVEKDTILDDFVMSLRIASQGYRVVYEPNAKASESASACVKEELKRKIRISAGGHQAIVRLSTLLNPFKHGILSWQYISHRVMRWTIAPLAMLLLIPVNLWLAIDLESHSIYRTILYAQGTFYLMALLGWHLENHQVRIKALFVPYYFVMMNLSVFLGFRRYIKGQQTVLWEKAKRR